MTRAARLVARTVPIALPAALALFSGCADRVPESRVAIPRNYELPYGPDPATPSEARLEGGGLLRPDALSGSAACGACHPAIYAQWQSSLHRAAGTDVFSRFAMDLTADNFGVAATRLCVGCHDPGALLAGLVDRRTRDAPVSRPEGVSCLSCHLVVATHEAPEAHVIANGSYDVATIDAALMLPDVSSDAAARKAHAAALRRPFLSENGFCDSCHRFFLPAHLIGKPTGRLRLQSQEAMGTAFESPVREGYRSCVDCHMPRIPGDDPAAKIGLIHDHRALGANVLVPTLEGNAGQARAVVDFRRRNAVEVRIGDLERDAGGNPSLPVVLYNGLNGHDFPTGATDISETWGELTLSDEAENVVYRSPGLDPGGFLSGEAPSLTTVVNRPDGDLDFLHDLLSQTDPKSHPRVHPGQSFTLRFPVPEGGPAGGPLTARVVLRARHGNQLWNRWTFNFEDVVVPVTDLAETSRVVGAVPPRHATEAVSRVAPAEPPEGMALIPGGNYVIGSDPAVDPEASRDEYPPHAVAIESFYLDRVPVTNALFRVAVERGAVKPPQDMQDMPFSRHAWKGGRPPEGLDDHPVVLVTREQASDYCRSVGKRLPIEAEWEAAARGFERRTYAWGGTFDAYLCNTLSSRLEMTLPVGSRPANGTPEGVLDLGCNVAEWVDSPMKAYPKKRNIDNRDEWYDHFQSGKVVLRGASYEMSPWRARGASRSRNDAEQFRIYGFRCARSAGTLP